MSTRLPCGSAPGLFAVLILMGAAWGAVFPIVKIAVSTGYGPYGIMVWQMMIGLALAGAILLARGRRPVLAPRFFGVFLGMALLGTVVPNHFSYTAAAHLPAGILSIVIALVPLFALPISLALGFEKPALLRFLGLGLGAVAVGLLIGPGARLPGSESAWYVILAAGAALAYAGEGNFLTWYGARGLDAFQILFGASLVSLVIALPVAVATGQFVSPFRPWQAADWAVLASSVINMLTYAAYVWTIGRAGPVFAAQVAYLITGFGVIWSILFLGEHYAPGVWAAMGLMLAGVFLVQPRRATVAGRKLVPPGGMGKDAL